MKKRTRISWLVPAMLSFATSIIAFISANVNRSLVLIVSGLLFLAGGIRSVFQYVKYIKQKKQQEEE